MEFFCYSATLEFDRQRLYKAELEGRFKCKLPNYIKKWKEINILPKCSFGQSQYPDFCQLLASFENFYLWYNNFHCKRFNKIKIIFIFYSRGPIEWSTDQLTFTNSKFSMRLEFPFIYHNKHSIFAKYASRTAKSKLLENCFENSSTVGRTAMFQTIDGKMHSNVRTG